VLLRATQWLITANLALTLPVVWWLVRLYGLPTGASSSSSHMALALAVLAGWLLLVHIRMGRFFTPLANWAERGAGRASARRYLARFTQRYWGGVLGAVLLMITLHAAGAQAAPAQPVAFALLALTGAVLCGLPVYLIALERLGRLLAALGVFRVQVGLRTRFILVGALLPLLGYLLLWQASQGSAALWAGLSLLSVGSAALAVRALTRALAPVQHTLIHGGASSHGALARLRPVSSDELGYLTELLGRQFERLHAQEQQRIAAEKRYRDLVETAHDLVWSVDVAGHWTYLNNASLAIYGLAPEQMIGRHISEFHAPDYAYRDAAAFADVLARKDLVQYETVHMDRHGHPHHLSFNAKAHYDSAGRIAQITGTARDISAQKAFEQRLAYKAEHDALTGLFNTDYFAQTLDAELSRITRGAPPCALCFVDLVKFKHINDTHGQGAGDRLLIAVARLLSATARKGDVLARKGGDEFLLLLYDTDPRQLGKVAEHLHEAFTRYTFYEAGQAHPVQARLGLVLIDQHLLPRVIKNAADAIELASKVNNLAKHAADRTHIFTPTERATPDADTGWAARLRACLDQGRFLLHFQPIVTLADGHAREVELLLRMPCEDGAHLLPDAFLPEAERFGLLGEIEHWVLAQALRRLAGLRGAHHALRLSINLSTQALDDAGLLPHLRTLLSETHIRPAQLCFEMNEQIAVARLPAAIELFTALKALGCRTALDDFGTGSASPEHLRALPVTRVNLAGRLIRGLSEHPEDQAIVRALVALAQALGREVLVKHVEDAASLALLTDLGVTFAQGNHLGAPGAELAVEPVLTLVPDRTQRASPESA
jgi:diguanylate cyclase (GGDEF)-like protein/PAS domain S-box-containing protein